MLLHWAAKATKRQKSLLQPACRLARKSPWLWVSQDSKCCKKRNKHGSIGAAPREVSLNAKHAAVGASQAERSAPLPHMQYKQPKPLFAAPDGTSCVQQKVPAALHLPAQIIPVFLKAAAPTIKRASRMRRVTRFIKSGSESPTSGWGANKSQSCCAESPVRTERSGPFAAMLRFEPAHASHRKFQQMPCLLWHSATGMPRHNCSGAAYVSGHSVLIKFFTGRGAGRIHPFQTKLSTFCRSLDARAQLARPATTTSTQMRRAAAHFPDVSAPLKVAKRHVSRVGAATALQARGTDSSRERCEPGGRWLGGLVG